jgi:nudix-type nucleoside diphosphatase (YffH/AdpP family)
MVEGPGGPNAVRDVFRGSLIRLSLEKWPSGEREVVRHPGACGVLPLTEADEVVLVRQFREPVREPLLEIPAGVYDVEGEEPAECAARELLEETGLRGKWAMEPLGTIYTSPGFADERIDLFLAAVSLSGAPQAAGGIEEGIEVVVMPLAEAVSAVQDGGIKDAKTAVAILLAAWRRS